MAEDIEIEIKVKIRNYRKFENFLKKNAKFVFENQQIDEYFTPCHRNFIASRPVREWLRLRDSDGKYFITYKNWHLDEFGKSTHCDEYETKLESSRQVQKILEVLGFEKIIVVDKLRRVWRYKDYEIAIDKVKGLGRFVEVEYKRKKKVDPKEIAKEMISFLKSTGCTKIQRDFVGYPFQLLFPDEVEYEEV